MYQCAGVAQDSLEEMRKNNYTPQARYHVLEPVLDGVTGEDRVGVLLMFEDEPLKVVQGEGLEKKPWSYWYVSARDRAINLNQSF